MQKENNQLTSSCSVGMRDINALLQSAPISRIKTLRDDEGRRGFTLIELLVVVLIIGILAAIALPQYQKAITKTKLQLFATELFDVRRAIQFYILEKGTSPVSFCDLPIATPIANSTACSYRGKTYITLNYFRTNHTSNQVLKTGLGPCDFPKDARYAFCYTYSRQVHDILRSLGWQCNTYSDCTSVACGKCYLWKQNP